MRVLSLVPLLATLTEGFSVVGPSTSRRGASVELHASRRDILQSLVVGGAAVVVGSPATAQAATEIDYSRIQDLLGSSDAAMGSSSSSYAPQPGKRPTYLTEPTDDFKQSEAKATEFKRQNLIQKQEFQGMIDRFDSAPNDEAALADSLDEMRRFIRRASGLPQGITKQELITTIRRRKAKKYWPTNVEIAYQDLLYEIQYQQSPNTQKNDENPL